LKYGYEVLFILVVEKNALSKSKYLKWTNWNENTDAVACIRCLYGTNSEFDIKKDIKEGHLAGSVMYSFEAENKAINFNIRQILTLGKTSKALSSNEAGKFGEGLKVGAVATLRTNFDLFIQGSGKSCNFHFRKSKMTKDFTLHAKLGEAAKRYIDLDIVGATLARSKLRYRGDHFETIKQNLGGIKERFLHEKYRALCLKEEKENEVLLGKETRCELLLAEHYKGSIFCRAIFVEKKKRLLFGYDLKEVELPMERNHVRDEELRKNVGKLLRDVLLGGDLDTSTRKNILDRILEMLASHHCRDMIEAQVLCDKYDDKDALLAKEIASHFEDLHGKDAFPCEKCQAQDVTEKLPGKKAHVVTKTCLEILHRGGYPTLWEAVDDLYSSKNKSRIRIDRSPYSAIVTKALKWVAKAGRDNISREHLMFLQASKLPRTGPSCRHNYGVYYLSDALIKGKHIEDESYMIAYHLIQACGGGDVLRKFIADRNESVDLELELNAISPGETEIEVTQSRGLFAREDLTVIVYELNVDHTCADEDSVESNPSAECTEASMPSQHAGDLVIPAVITVPFEKPPNEFLDGGEENADACHRVQSSPESHVKTLGKEVFRQRCCKSRKFRVNGLKHSTKYIVQAVSSENVVVKDSVSGEKCRSICRTNLLFKEPRTVSIRCFESHQVISSMGGINIELGVRFMETSSADLHTKWQEDEEIRLKAQKGSELQILCREKDDLKPNQGAFFNRLLNFDCQIPARIDHPPSPLIVNMWNSENGCTIKVVYPDALPPGATIVFWILR